MGTWSFWGRGRLRRVDVMLTYITLYVPNLDMHWPCWAPWALMASDGPLPLLIWWKYQDKCTVFHSNLRINYIFTFMVKCCFNLKMNFRLISKFFNRLFHTLIIDRISKVRMNGNIAFASWSRQLGSVSMSKLFLTLVF